MGKPKKEVIWKHFRLRDDKTIMCSHCDTKYNTANVVRMEKHLQRCLKCPANYKAEILDILSKPKKNADIVKKPSTPTSFRPDEGQKENFSPNAESSTILTPSASLRVNPLSIGDKHDLDMALSKAIFVTGSPFVMVEHPLWIEFFEKLQPLYTLPSRKTLSTTYLDKIYGNMRKETIEDLSMQSYLHLQCDGWSDVRNEGIINFLISKPEPVFVKSLDTADNRHTSEYLAQEILKVMNEYGRDKFFALVGDNTKNIQKAFKLVKDSQPHITYLNCAAHTLNLLCHDILRTEKLKIALDIAIECVKSIKKSQVLTSILASAVKQKKAGETLKLPCKTRWGSYCVSLQSLIKTKLALQTLAVHEKASMLPTNTKRNLLNEDFWDKTKQIIDIIKPVTQVIFKLEADKLNIRTVFLTLRNMKSELEFALLQLSMLNEDEKHDILMATFHRMEMCIKPIHLAAYILDPATQGSELDSEEEVVAMEYIHTIANQLNIDIAENLASFRARDGRLWGKAFVWKSVTSMSPTTWWKGICSSTSLSKIALRILTAPCTSAAVERSFSTHGKIHNKLRNRLTAERAAKIAYVAYNWNLLNRSITCSVEEEVEEDEEYSVNSSGSESSNDEISVVNEIPSLDALLSVVAGPSGTQPHMEFFDCDNLNSDSD